MITTIKVCSCCNEPKPTTEFYSNFGRCKKCTIQRQKEWRQNNPEKVRAALRKWQRNNRDRVNVNNRNYYKRHREEKLAATERWRKINHEKILFHAKKRYWANPVKHNARQREQYKKDPEKFRDRSLKQKYGITLNDYNELFWKQHGACVACGKKPVAGRKGFRLVVDHDHKTGEIRGLLCSWCNGALGFVSDDPSILSRLIEYLEQFACRKKLVGG